MKLVLFLSLFISQLAFAVVSKPVLYEKDKLSFEGLLVQPEHLKAKNPAILMIHNWMGVTEETKFQAERMAKLGFVVFAADIYGQGIRPSSPAEAGKLASTYKGDRSLFRERLLLALETLKKQEGVDADAIIGVGYCFGGTGIIELARAGAAVLGVVSFHGGLDSPNQADGANIKAKVLALQGADDPTVPASDMLAFENEMRTYKVDWQLNRYGGAVHSFTEKSAGSDNSTGVAYNESADRRSFEDFRDFAREVLAL